MESRNRKMLTLVVASVLIVAVGIGAWLFFGGDAPSEVDLEATAAAVQGVTTTTVEGAAATTTTPPSSTAAPGAEETPAPTTGDVSGTWNVDTSIGDFTVSGDTTATFAGFRVDEVLATVGETTAVGRTPSITGSIEIEGTALVGVDIAADLTGIKSDRSRREGPIQRALNTSTHPQATFSLTESIELGPGATDGEVVEAIAVGDLTINGITKSVQLPVRAQLIEDTILVTAAMDLTFSDFDVSAPSAASVLSVEDVGVLELQLWLSR